MFCLRLDTDAAFLSNLNSLSGIIARRLDLKAPKSGFLPSIVSAVRWNSNSIMKCFKHFKPAHATACPVEWARLVITWQLAKTRENECSGNASSAGHRPSKVRTHKNVSKRSLQLQAQWYGNPEVFALKVGSVPNSCRA